MPIMFGFKKKAKKEESKQFRIVVNQPQQKNEALSIDVLDEASNELLLSQSIEQPQQSPLSPPAPQFDEQQRVITPPAPNSETQRLSQELNEMKKIFAEYGIEKLREQQRILQSQNAELQNQILAKQSLVTELEKQLQIMKDNAVDAFRQNIDAYGMKFIAEFINKG